MLQLFEYAVILQAKTDKDGNTVDKGDVVVPVTTVLAKDQEQAQLLAARSIPDDNIDDLDRLTVVVRPF